MSHFTVIYCVKWTWLQKYFVYLAINVFGITFSFITYVYSAYTRVTVKV